MRKLLFGTIAAATILMAPQAMAQVGFYFGPGGAGVEFGSPHPYYDYYAPRYYVPRGDFYRYRDNSDSYWRWREEGYPSLKTPR